MIGTRNPNGLEPYDPDDVSIYGIDWRDWLAPGEAITGEAWSIAPADGAPTFMPRGSFADRLTVVTLTSGGIPGTTYTLTCQATKSNGEKKTRSFHVECREG